MEPPVCLQVNRVARSECNQLQVSSDAIDDPEPPDPIAAKATQLVAEGLAGVGILEKRLERGADLAFENRMKAADKHRDFVWNPQTAWRRHSGEYRSPYSNSSSSV